MERIETGKIVNTHGIRGELKIQPWADGPESLTGLSVLYLDAAGTRPLEIERARVHPGQCHLQIQGCGQHRVRAGIQGPDRLHGQGRTVARAGRVLYCGCNRPYGRGRRYRRKVRTADGRLPGPGQRRVRDRASRRRRVLFPAIRDVVIETDIRAGPYAGSADCLGMFDI